MAFIIKLLISLFWLGMTAMLSVLVASIYSDISDPQIRWGWTVGAAIIFLGVTMLSAPIVLTSKDQESDQ